MSIVEKFRTAKQYLYSPKVRFCATALKGIADCLDSDSKFEKFKIAMQTVGELSTVMTETAACFSSWQDVVQHDSFNSLFLELAKQYPYEDVEIRETFSCRVHIIDGVKMGYYVYNDDDCDEVLQSPEPQKAYEVLRSKIWSLYKDGNVVMSPVQSKTKKHYNETCTFRYDDSMQMLDSDIAERLKIYCNKFIAKSKNRSIMLYGRPGTGKSTIAKTVVKSLGLKSFRINLQDLSRGVDQIMLDTAIDLFQPDALIIDDIDRTGAPDDLLTMLEKCRAKIKIIFLTANDYERLSEAVCRPQRIDKFVMVEKLDDTIIDSIVKTRDFPFSSIILSSPVSYIQEARDLLDCFEGNELHEELRELANRAISSRGNDSYDRGSELLNENTNERDKSSNKEQSNCLSNSQQEISSFND